MGEIVGVFASRLEFIDTLKGIESISEEELSSFESFFKNRLRIIEVLILSESRVKRKEGNMKDVE